MRVMVTGSRDWSDVETILTAMVEVAPGEGHTLVHGNARGADKIAAEVAKHSGWQIEPYDADWEAHGRAAGPIRNAEMVKTGADVLLAFPSKGSKGTWDCVRKAVDAGIITYIYPLRSK